MTHVDSAGLAAFDEFVRDLRRDGITRQGFDESGLSDEIGPERFYSTVRAAVAACEDA